MATWLASIQKSSRSCSVNRPLSRLLIASSTPRTRPRARTGTQTMFLVTNWMMCCAFLKCRGSFATSLIRAAWSFAATHPATPCLETIEIRTQNLSTIIKNHKAHTDTDINPDRQDKTSSSFPPEMEKISLSRFFWGVGGGAGGQAGFGKELLVWNCI